MQMRNFEQAGIARIYLKNGRQQTGLLLNDVNLPNAFDQGVHFVPNNDLDHYLLTADRDVVCVLESEQVDEIDLFLR